MQGAVLYGARDIRFEDRAEPTIVEPTDAIISLPVTCICGSDLWPYRGIQATPGPVPMGHEYCGIVEEIGRGVTSLKRGQFVIGSFFASDNTCPQCRHGYQTSCQQREPVVGAQAPRMRVPLAEGTLVATRDAPDPEMIASMLALSDVMGTGWFAADAANVKPGATVVVVGDGAVGLLGVLSAKQMGAERIIAMSRHQTRQKLAREFGATDIVTERGDEGVERIKQLTNGVGADSVLECVGTQESMQQAIRSTRPSGDSARARLAALKTSRRSSTGSAGDCAESSAASSTSLRSPPARRCSRGAMGSASQASMSSSRVRPTCARATSR